jgi:hypothetical protein
MRKFWFVASLIAGTWAHAQLVPLAIVPDEQHVRTAHSHVKPPISLPFWDDFSWSGDKPDSLWEFSERVFVNEALSILPPTYKAATFDGVDASGQMYDGNAEFPGLGDELISRAILLAGQSNVYLSFFWQAGGNGEMPDVTDSLRLQFLAADSTWVTVWSKLGGPHDRTVYTQEIMPVTAPYLSNHFRFRFQSFGSLQGPFDTWHVDYVFLNSDRNANDLTYFDRAFTGSISALIEPYKVMPAEHFFKDPQKYLVHQNVSGSNLHTTPHTFEIDYYLKNLSTGEEYIFDDGSKSFASGEKKTVTLNQSISILPISPEPDSVWFRLKISSVFSDPVTPVNVSSNDSISARYLFHNYYAYDDGIAEFAAGINLVNGKVAVEFPLETKDTLTHVDIYFPRIAPSSVGKSVNIMVWTSLDPEQILIEQPYVISGTSNRDVFTRIKLAIPLIVEGTIFIGYKQNIGDYIGIGVDRNNTVAQEMAWYRTSQFWEQNSSVQGVLMIRPVFTKNPDMVLGVKPKIDFRPYPNPVQNRLVIPEHYSRMEVYSLHGHRVMQEGRQGSHDLSFLAPGVYLLRIYSPDGESAPYKLLKN